MQRPIATVMLCLSVCGVMAGSRRAGGTEPGNWPAFLGPVPSRLSAEALPLKWSDDEHVAWRAELAGYGQSSPVVWNGRVFVTSISGSMKETCHVTALALATGQKLWQRDFKAAMPVRNTNYTSKAAPTPLADPDGLIAWFESGNLVAFDYEGRIRWQRDLVSEYGQIDTRHGLGSSLVQTNQLAIVWVERQTDPYILAVDKKTGQTRWKVPGLRVATWSTPCLMSVDGRRQLVFSGGGRLAGLDPRNGKRLWTFDDVSDNTVPSPRPIADGRLLIGASADRDDKGGGRVAESNGLLRVARGEAGRYVVDFQWRCRRATSSFGSPIHHRGLVYFISRAGVLYCVDGASGKERYAKRVGDTVWATPLPVGDRIYLAGKKGTTVVVRAGREFEILARNQLHPRTDSNQPFVQYALIAVERYLLIRTGSELICVGDP